MVILWYSMITCLWSLQGNLRCFDKHVLLEEHLSASLIFAFLNCLSSNYSMFLFVNGEVLHCVCENVLSLSCPALEKWCVSCVAWSGPCGHHHRLGNVSFSHFSTPFPAEQRPLLCNTIQSSLCDIKKTKTWPFLSSSERYMTHQHV